MKEKEKNGRKILRDSMSSDEKAKASEKETIARKWLRDGISPDGKVKVVYCYDPEGNIIEVVEELN